MTNYGPSVGFRVSAEEFRSGAEGRQRVPLTAVGPNAIRQFDLVTFDPANPGFLRKAPADSPIEPGYTGLAVQESAHLGLREGALAFDLPAAQVTQERLEGLYAQHEDELRGDAPPASPEPLPAAPAPAAMHCR